MTPEQTAILTRYQHLRQVGLALNTRLFRTVGRSGLDEGGKKLGILKKNTLVLDTEDEMAVLADFCIHDVRRKGANAVDRYLAQSPPPADSDEMVFLQALRQARFAVVAVESSEPGFGVHVRDLLRDEPLFLVDVGLSHTARPGLVLAARVMTADGITKTTGAALPVGRLSAAQRAQYVQGLANRLKGADFRQLSPKQASELAAFVLRGCLDAGAAERIGYIDPAAGGSPPRQPPRRRGRG
jgi:hypothetical protein